MVVTTYLEMGSAAEHTFSTNARGLEVKEAVIQEYRFNRYLYSLVGAAWQWTDKLLMTDAQWQAYAEVDSLRTWVAYYQGSIAGYFELHSDDSGNVEIGYFGLAEKFIGKGFGRYFLSQAIDAAWQQCQAKRVWVHTCSLDHPNALSNYQQAGFKIYQEETE
jgi:GNAT superfamily N-acetyltransferase